MLSSFSVAIPTGIKILNWVATLWRGSLVMKTPLYFAVAVPALFVFGGVTGIQLAIFPIDWELHDTYFVVAHFHYTLFGGSVFGVFAAVYYWFPKITGRMLSEAIGKLSFWLMFIGFNLTFLIQHSAGLSGMPRRIYWYPKSAGWETLCAKTATTLRSKSGQERTRAILPRPLRLFAKRSRRAARPLEGCRRRSSSTRASRR